MYSSRASSIGKSLLPAAGLAAAGVAGFLISQPILAEAKSRNSENVDGNMSGHLQTESFGVSAARSGGGSENGSTNDPQAREILVSENSVFEAVQQIHEEDKGHGDIETEKEGAEGEADGAFNPETGEINWDCPCLGGMAQGTCGPEFKAAFSCFIFSESDPKGFECVEKFKAMQDCFRAHPEEYASELAETEGDDEMDGDEEEIEENAVIFGDSNAETVPKRTKLAE
jgi:hypothetical protein